MVASLRSDARDVEREVEGLRGQGDKILKERSRAEEEERVARALLLVGRAEFERRWRL
jgi:hypothetical protein